MIFALGLYASGAMASAETPNAKPVFKAPGYADAMNWSLSLVLVLTIFLLCIWLIRKTGQFSLPGRQQLNIVTALSLGMREKVVLIKVGNKQLLLGVTPNRIDKLMELEGEDRLYQESADLGRGDFADKLRQALKGRSDG